MTYLLSRDNYLCKENFLADQSFQDFRDIAGGGGVAVAGGWWPVAGNACMVISLTIPKYDWPFRSLRFSASSSLVVGISMLTDQRPLRTCVTRDPAKRPRRTE